MKSLDVAKYLVGYDILRETRNKEKAVHIERGSDSSHPLPLDAGLEGVLDIYIIRTVAAAKHTGAIVCRQLGIDAVYRLATHTEFPQQ